MYLFYQCCIDYLLLFPFIIIPSDGKVYVFERVSQDHYERVSEVHDVSESIVTPDPVNHGVPAVSDPKASMYICSYLNVLFSILNFTVENLTYNWE